MMKKLFTLSFILFSFFANADYWTQKANFPGTNIVAPNSFSIGTKGYAGCGANSNISPQKSFWEYDQITNIWTQKADFGGGKRYVGIGLAILNKGYMGLGYDSTGNINNLTKDFWEYDPLTNAWTQKADFGGGPRFGATGFCIGNKGYAGFGRDTTNMDFQDFWEYDPAANVWTQKADCLGGPRSKPIGFSIGSKGYIATGGHSPFFYNDLWEYNPTANSWTVKANIPAAGRTDAAGFSIGNKALVGTGEASNNIYLKDFWEYCPGANTWTQKTSFAGTARDETAFFFIGNKGYIGLGDRTGSPFYYDFWEYTPDSASCPTGIEENTLSTWDFAVSPNPAKDFIVISYPLNGKENIYITITDVAGKKVYESKLQTATSNFKVQTSNYPKGTYIVELTNGKEKVVKKFVKE